MIVIDDSVDSTTYSQFNRVDEEGKKVALGGCSDDRFVERYSLTRRTFGEERRKKHDLLKVLLEKQGLVTVIYLEKARIL